MWEGGSRKHLRIDMNKLKLVIAEKPSVAQSLAKVIGATEKKEGYLEGNEYLVSWCVGHLGELAEPEDMRENTEKLIPVMAEKFGFIKTMNVHMSQLINNKKVSDHHALLPTKNVANADFSELPSGEVKILSLIVARILAGVGDPYLYQETSLELTAGGAVFKAKGKQEMSKGWKEVQAWILGKAVEEKEQDQVMTYLSDLQEGRNYPLRDPQIPQLCEDQGCFCGIQKVRL